MPQRVTVILLHNTRAIGGVEVSLAGWMQYLDRNRLNPLLYCFEEADGAETAFAAYLRKRDIPLSILPWGSRKRIVPAVRELVRVIRANRPCVLHVNDMRPELVGITASKLTGCPLVSSNHGWHSIWGGIGLKRQRNDVLRAFFARFCDLNIAVGECVRAESIRRGIDPQKVITLHTGVNHSEFINAPDTNTARSRLGYQPGEFVIGNFARLYPEKAQDVLVNAFASIAHEFPHARLLIVGTGPLQSAIERQIRSLGLEGCVRLLPFQDDIAALYAAVDLFVLPSHAEGAALVLYKAMLAGVPVVASNVAAAPELIRDGIDGLLVPPGNPDALAGALRKMLTLDDDSLRRMGQAAGELARADPRFSIRSSAAALTEIYMRMVQ